MCKKTIIFKLFNISQNQLDKVILKAKEISDNNIEIQTETKYIDTKLNILYSDNILEGILDETLRMIVHSFEDNIYCEEDRSLEEVLFEILKIQGKMIGIGESFTGGRVSSSLVSVSGASSVFNEGIVAYSNYAKNERLFVRENTLSEFGAVSKETAYEMVNGLLKNKRSDFAIATTGIAGPKSDDTNKPVGLCFIATGDRNGIHVHKLNLSGTREEITEQGRQSALFFAIKQLKNC